MKLKDKELGLFIVTLVKGLKELRESEEIPDTIGTVYLKMITLLVNHFIYSIKDLKSIEEFTEEEKINYRSPSTGSISRSRFSTRGRSFQRCYY